jgi:hypothetical protein
MQIWIMIFMSASVHIQHPQAPEGGALTLLTPWVVGSEAFSDQQACESALTRFALDPAYEWHRDGFLLNRTHAGLIARKVVSTTTEQAQCYPITAPVVQKMR